jgi:hypothetical protein
MSKVKVKPFKSMNGKTFTATPEHLNAEVYAEINEHKVRIDRASFEKSCEERLALKAARKAWNKNPARDKDVIDSFSKARMPRKWNVSISTLAELN